MVTLGDWKIVNRSSPYIISAVTDDKVTDVASVDNKDDADLMVASKDMYEALKELREWIQSSDVKFLGKGFTEQFGIPKTFNKVDKALAKAEGK